MAINDWLKLTPDEFGKDLFTCIAKFSERQWIRDVKARMVQREEQTATLLDYGKCTKPWLDKYEANLTREISALMEKLEPDDVRRLLAKYETPIAV